MEESISKETLNCESFVDAIKNKFDLKGVDIRTYSPLTLAFIGDAIYEVVIRTMIVEQKNESANKLHRETTTYVKAVAQAKMIEALLPYLTEGELSVYKRGRNAKSYTSAKNASIIEYRMATGLEALFGFLYLNNENERMLELIKTGVDLLNQ